MKAIDLKNSILGLAISGKLTSQEPTDESVDTLIENIQKFKENLILNGRLKPNKKKILDTSVDESLEVPKSWRVVRLGDIADLYTGDSIPELIKSTRYAKVDDGYDYIGTKDVGFDNVINYSNGVKIPFDEKGFKQAHKNSILLCIEGGSAGRKIAKLDRTVCFGNKLCAIAPFGFDSTKEISAIPAKSLIKSTFS